MFVQRDQNQGTNSFIEYRLPVLFILIFQSQFVGILRGITMGVANLNAIPQRPKIISLETPESIPTNKFIKLQIDCK